MIDSLRQAIEAGDRGHWDRARQILSSLLQQLEAPGEGQWAKTITLPANRPDVEAAAAGASEPPPAPSPRTSELPPGMGEPGVIPWAGPQPANTATQDAPRKGGDPL